MTCKWYKLPLTKPNVSFRPLRIRQCSPSFNLAVSWLIHGGVDPNYGSKSWGPILQVGGPWKSKRPTFLLIHRLICFRSIVFFHAKGFESSFEQATNILNGVWLPNCCFQSFCLFFLPPISGASWSKKWRLFSSGEKIGHQLSEWISLGGPPVGN